MDMDGKNEIVEVEGEEDGVDVGVSLARNLYCQLMLLRGTLADFTLSKIHST